MQRIGIQFRCVLGAQSGQQTFEFGDCLTGVETLRIEEREREIITRICLVDITRDYLRTRFGAIHDGVATIDAERVLQLAESFFGRFVTRIDDPAIGLGTKAQFVGK